MFRIAPYRSGGNARHLGRLRIESVQPISAANVRSKVPRSPLASTSTGWRSTPAPLAHRGAQSHRRYRQRSLSHPASVGSPLRPRPCAAGGPRLANPLHFIAKAVARELFRGEHAHTSGIKRQRTGVDRLATADIAGDVYPSGRLDSDTPARGRLLPPSRELR